MNKILFLFFYHKEFSRNKTYFIREISVVRQLVLVQLYHVFGFYSNCFNYSQLQSEEQNNHFIKKTNI